MNKARRRKAKRRRRTRDADLALVRAFKSVVVSMVRHRQESLLGLYEHMARLTAPWFGPKPPAAR